MSWRSIPSAPYGPFHGPAPIIKCSLDNDPRVAGLVIALLDTASFLALGIAGFASGALLFRRSRSWCPSCGARLSCHDCSTRRPADA